MQVNNKNKQRQKRRDRLAKQQVRGGKRSYVTEVENLQILLAWYAGALGMGETADALGVSRRAAGQLLNTAIKAGVLLAKCTNTNDD